MASRVGIVGASGYGGAELVRLVDAHPAIELVSLAAHSQAGELVSDLFPNLAGERRFDAIDVAALSELDLVFLATPHVAALDLAPQLLDGGTRVVDLSGAHRLPADAFATWYGMEHPSPHLAAAHTAVGDEPSTGAVYGLTEHQRDAIAAADLVANPGCYPTATLLGLLPLRDAVEPGSIVVDAKSGTSGAGRGTADHLHFSHVHADLVAYGTPGHRHTGEIEEWSGLGPVTFAPHLVPMSRGLLATVHGRVVPGTSASQIQDRLVAAYEAETFVTVLAPGSFPHTKAVAGSNGCQVSAVLDPRTGRVTVTSAIDNLGKGAAGQALQNANLMLGLDEACGLTTIGVYP